MFVWPQYGETGLLPQNKGYSQMISAFVLRSFGIKIKLTDKELAELIERRISEKWGIIQSQKLP